MTDHPSHWTILNEYSKSILTLGSSLLAAVVTFSDKFVSSMETAGGYILFGLYISLLIAIVSALLTAAFIYKSLKLKDNGKREYAFEKHARKVANVSYIAIGCSALLFLVIGVIPSRKKDASIYADKAMQIVQRIWHVDAKLCLLHLAQLEPGSRFYRIVIYDSAHGVSHTIRFDADKGDVVSLE